MRVRSEDTAMRVHRVLQLQNSSVCVERMCGTTEADPLLVFLHIMFSLRSPQNLAQPSPSPRTAPVDTSAFSIEERLVAGVWVHERARMRLSMGQIKRDFKQRFDKEPPTKNTLLMWEKKLFATGNMMDAKRSGRPCQRKEHIEAVKASVHQSPGLSLRARAAALSVPRTTLRKILRDDLRVEKRTLKKSVKSAGSISTVKRKKEEKQQRKPSQKAKPNQNQQSVSQIRQPINQNLQPTNQNRQPIIQNRQPMSQHPPHDPIHYSNTVNYNYTDMVVPMHIPEYNPYMSYQGHENKLHHQMDQHYVVQANGIL